MKYDKCPICNEKLKNGICPMCGYDFHRLEGRQRSGSTRNRPDYRVGPNEEPKRSMTKQHKRAHRQFRTERKSGTGKVIKFILTLVAASGILLDVASEADISGLIEQVKIFVKDEEQDQQTKTISKSTYDEVSYPLSTTGKKFSADLSSGRYVVGLDLPEGVYTVTGTGEEIGFSVTNDAQYIDIYELLTDHKSIGSEQNSEVKDVRLYQGSLIEISGRGTIHCNTSDARMEKLKESSQNPLNKEVEVTGVMTAGKDFPAGTYDVVALSGQGEFNFVCEQDKDDEDGGESIWLSGDSEGDEAQKYKNLELADGTEIKNPTEADFQVKLVPSRRVRPENVHVYDSSNGLDS